MELIRHRISEHKALAIVVGAAVALLVGFLLFINFAKSHTSPGGCSTTGVFLFLTVFRADGVTPVGAGSATPGETLKYEATLSHPGPPLCDYGGGALGITTPDGVITDVTPGGGIPLISFGSPFVSAQVSYVVSSAHVGGDGDLDASTTYAGGTSHLGGDVTPVGATTPAATLFAKLTPTVTTEIHNASEVVVTSVPAGTTVHDKATVSGSFGTPTGTVDFTFFTNGTCTPTGSAAGNVALDGSGIAHPSTSQGPLDAGSYSFKAHYNGNDDYDAADSACEPLTVTKLDPLVVTEIHDGSEAVVTSVLPGTTVHDKATVSGSFGTPTGTVDFTFYTSGDCTTGASASGNVALDGSGIAHPSTSQGPLGTGSYSFRATYNGNQNYNSATSACEPLDVVGLRSTVDTQVHDPAHTDITNTAVPVGTPVHDKATVSGAGPTPTGSVTFNLHGNSSCTGSPIATEIVALSLSGVAESTATSTLAFGSYGYLVSYGGDSTYSPSDSICEPFAIQHATRTQGFWQTHTVYTTGVFTASPISSSMPIGSPLRKLIDSTGKLFGAYYSSIPYKSTGSKRLAIDRARMQLLQQLVTAELNCAAFGCPASTLADIATAHVAYSGGSSAAILASAATLDAYNNSGDALPIPGPVGPATPQTSQALASLAFWDSP